MKKISAMVIARIALMTAVTCVLSQCSIPLPGLVPITLQTFAVALTGSLLGWKEGAIALLVYLLLGSVGVPVFAGFGAGFGKLAGATGGYLIGFPIMAALCGAGRNKSIWAECALGLLGLLILDVMGTFWLSHVAGMGMKEALMAGVAPFVIKDIASVILAGLLGRTIRKRLPEKVRA